MKYHKIKNLAVGAGFSALLAVGAASAEEIVLQMAVPDWFPTRALEELAAGYESSTGADARVEFDFIPWGNYYERLAASFASGEEKYHMAVIDSQWLGAFVENGAVMRLDDLVAADPELAALQADIHPSLVKSYSTYPYGSDTIYGFPQMADTMVAYYRTDLFCDEGEAAAFQAEYGEALPCSYEDVSAMDWDQVEKVGAFFTRSAGETLAGEELSQDVYGLGMAYGQGFDFVSMMAVPFFWQFGGNIWDETQQPTGQAMGVVNSDANKAAFERMLSFMPYNPPGAGNIGPFEIAPAFAQGQIAYALNWAALGAPIADPGSSLVADRFDVAQPPGNTMDGEFVRYWNVGGQPFVLTNWIPDDKIDHALDFVKFWLSDETQLAFAKAGGSVSRVSLNSNDEYAAIAPWNRAFADALDYQRDLWHVPEFFELIVQQQEVLNSAAIGSMSVSDALDAIAVHQDDILREAGRIE